MKITLTFDISREGYGFCSGFYSDLPGITQLLPNTLTEGYKRYKVLCEIPDPTPVIEIKGVVEKVES